MSAKRFTPGGQRRPAVGRRLAPVLAVILSLPIPASAALVVRRGGSGGMAQIADALEKALERKPSGKKPHVVELSGDSAADSARLAREAEGETVVFAIGAEAVTTAGGSRGSPSSPSPCPTRPR